MHALYQRFIRFDFRKKKKLLKDAHIYIYVKLYFV